MPGLDAPNLLGCVGLQQCIRPGSAHNEPFPNGEQHPAQRQAPARPKLINSCIIHKFNYWAKSEHFLPLAALAACTGQGPEPLVAFAG